MRRRDGLRIELVAMTTADFPAVAGWLADPEVARWWDLPPDPEAVAARYGPAVAGDEPTQYVIVRVEGRDAGFAEWYFVDDHPDFAEVVGRPGAAGIDYALAGDYRGRGVGPLVIDELALAAVADHPAAQRVVAAPVVANRRSWRALQRAQFSLAGEIDQPGEGPSFLHERPAGAAGLRATLAATFDWFEVNSGWAPPPPETLSDWAADGLCRAPDECWTSVEAPCPHGLASWISVLRYVE